MKSATLLLLFLPAFTLLLGSFTRVPFPPSERSLTVKVMTESGNPVYYAKVGYSVCESLSCLGGKHDFRTDRNGEAVITWSTDCSICIIYVDGKAYKGKYKEDGIYTFAR